MFNPVQLHNFSIDKLHPTLFASRLNLVFVAFFLIFVKFCFVFEFDGNFYACGNSHNIIDFAKASDFLIRSETASIFDTDSVFTFDQLLNAFALVDSQLFR